MATTATVTPTGTLTLQWDPKNLEIRTFSVEKTLEPLVMQVLSVVNLNVLTVVADRSAEHV